MITVTLHHEENQAVYRAFEFSGHAEYDESGERFSMCRCI